MIRLRENAASAHSTSLHRQQGPALIDVTTHPGAARIHLGNHLTAKNRRPQIVRRGSTFNFLHPQPIAVIALRQGRARRVGLLPRGIIGVTLITIIGEIAAGVV